MDAAHGVGLKNLFLDHCKSSPSDWATVREALLLIGVRRTDLARLKRRMVHNGLVEVADFVRVMKAETEMGAREFSVHTRSFGCLHEGGTGASTKHASPPAGSARGRQRGKPVHLEAAYDAPSQTADASGAWGRTSTPGGARGHLGRTPRSASGPRAGTRRAARAPPEQPQPPAATNRSFEYADPSTAVRTHGAGEHQQLSFHEVARNIDTHDALLPATVAEPQSPAPPLPSPPPPAPTPQRGTPAVELREALPPPATGLGEVRPYAQAQMLALAPLPERLYASHEGPAAMPPHARQGISTRPQSPRRTAAPASAGHAVHDDTTAHPLVSPVRHAAGEWSSAAGFAVGAGTASGGGGNAEPDREHPRGYYGCTPPREPYGPPASTWHPSLVAVRDGSTRGRLPVGGVPPVAATGVFCPPADATLSAMFRSPAQPRAAATARATRGGPTSAAVLSHGAPMDVRQLTAAAVAPPPAPPAHAHPDPQAQPQRYPHAQVTHTASAVPGGPAVVEVVIDLSRRHGHDGTAVDVPPVAAAHAGAVDDCVVVGLAGGGGDLERASAEDEGHISIVDELEIDIDLAEYDDYHPNGPRVSAPGSFVESLGFERGRPDIDPLAFTGAATPTTPHVTTNAGGTRTSRSEADIIAWPHKPPGTVSTGPITGQPWDRTRSGEHAAVDSRRTSPVDAMGAAGALPSMDGSQADEGTLGVADDCSAGSDMDAPHPAPHGREHALAATAHIPRRTLSDSGADAVALVARSSTLRMERVVAEGAPVRNQRLPDGDAAHSDGEQSLCSGAGGLPSAVAPHNADPRQAAASGVTGTTHAPATHPGMSHINARAPSDAGASNDPHEGCLDDAGAEYDDYCDYHPDYYHHPRRDGGAGARPPMASPARPTGAPSVPDPPPQPVRLRSSSHHLVVDIPPRAVLQDRGASPMHSPANPRTPLLSVTAPEIMMCAAGGEPAHPSQEYADTSTSPMSLPAVPAAAAEGVGASAPTDAQQRPPESDNSSTGRDDATESSVCPPAPATHTRSSTGIGVGGGYAVLDVADAGVDACVVQVQHGGVQVDFSGLAGGYSGEMETQEVGVNATMSLQSVPAHDPQHSDGDGAMSEAPVDVGGNQSVSYYQCHRDEPDVLHTADPYDAASMCSDPLLSAAAGACPALPPPPSTTSGDGGAEGAVEATTEGGRSTDVLPPTRMPAAPHAVAEGTGGMTDVDGTSSLRDDDVEITAIVEEEEEGGFTQFTHVPTAPIDTSMNINSAGDGAAIPAPTRPQSFVGLGVPTVPVGGVGGDAARLAGVYRTPIRSPDTPGGVSAHTSVLNASGFAGGELNFSGVDAAEADASVEQPRVRYAAARGEGSVLAVMDPRTAVRGRRPSGQGSVLDGVLRSMAGSGRYTPGGGGVHRVQVQAQEGQGGAGSYAQPQPQPRRMGPARCGELATPPPPATPSGALGVPTAGAPAYHTPRVDLTSPLAPSATRPPPHPSHGSHPSLATAYSSTPRRGGGAGGAARGVIAASAGRISPPRTPRGGSYRTVRHGDGSPVAADDLDHIVVVNDDVMTGVSTRPPQVNRRPSAQAAQPRRKWMVEIEEY